MYRIRDHTFFFLCARSGILQFLSPVSGIFFLLCMGKGSYIFQVKEQVSYIFYVAGQDSCTFTHAWSFVILSKTHNYLSLFFRKILDPTHPSATSCLYTFSIILLKNTHLCFQENVAPNAPKRHKLSVHTVSLSFC